MDSMESRLVAQALNYHGQQLQKVWEGERNENELVMLNLKDPNFEIYQQRQKTLSFGDRGKRLKLQQFIAKKADTLYDKSNLDKINEPVNLETGDEEFYATMPGLDSFVPMEKTQRIRNFLESLIVGDVIYAQVMGKSNAGLLLKIICNCSDCPRVVIDLAIKALILNTATVAAVDKKGTTRSYMTNDLVCVAVSEVNVEAERVVGVMNVPPREGQASHPSLGLIHVEDLPDAYKKVMDNKGQGYDKIMENSSGFNNPNNIKYLSGLLGLGSEHHSNMVGLKERFPPSEFASELRQVQASKWAFRSVADGIDHFKAGRHTEAFQCLNKALTVDPKNVEGLVARGALYANSGSFKKAIEDFETALKLNQTHANARKYMAETLVALGRSYEDEKKFEDAQKAYEDCLAIAPYHEEARNSIEYIKTKTTNPTIINPLEPFKTSFETEAEPVDAKKDKKKRKKERKSRSKKRQRWSSSSDSSSSGSSSSSSSDSSSSSSSESSTISRSPSRKRKHKKDHHPSLSPLSKRMNQCNNPPATSSNSQDDATAPSFSGTSKENVNDYDVKVMKFLEQTQDDSDYEDKVRRFLEETARWKKEKEKKVPETDKSKKKKKKEKKGKDKEDKKSRKKKRKEERKKRRSKDKLERDLEALKRSSLPDLEQLESKLSAYHAKVEKKTVLSSRFSSHFNEMPSPLHHSNAEKLSEVSRRDDDHLRREREKERERDDAGKSYHERDTRMQPGPQQRKGFYPEVQQRKSMGGDLFDSHHPSQMDHKMPALDTAALNAKWRAAQAARSGDDSGTIGKWQNIHPDSKQSALSDDELDNKIQRPMEKSFSIRKQQNHRDQDKRSSTATTTSSSSAAAPPPQPPSPPPIIQKDQVLSIKQNTIKYPTPQPQNKFQSYKETSRPQSPNKYTSSLGGKFQPIGQSHPPEPPGPCPPSKRSKGGSHSDSDSDDDNNDRRRLSSRRRDESRNSNNGGGGRRLSRERQLRRSRTPRTRSPSRSSSGSRSRSVRRSRSRTYSNRRSGSYERKYSRSQSGSYSRSRSRSRSRSYSRSRSRSRSGDRGHYRKRQFRQFNNRGTYYKPRFQGFNNHQNHRGGNQNNYQNRNNRFYNNNNNNQHNRFNNRNRGNYNNRGQNRGRLNNRGGGGGSSGRFFHNNKPGFRDYRDRRDFRDRRGSRDRYSDRSYSPDPMRKVDEAKEKINKMLEGDEGGMDRNEQQVLPPLPPNKRHDGPLSEGEERDDDDYERWTEADNQDTSKTNERSTDVILDGRDNFIERMKQRSKNVLIQREAAARVW